MTSHSNHLTVAKLIELAEKVKQYERKPELHCDKCGRDYFLIGEPTPGRRYFPCERCRHLMAIPEELRVVIEASGFLRFRPAGAEGIAVTTKKGTILGRIQMMKFGRSRKWAFEPMGGTIYSHECLKSLGDKVSTLEKERKNERESEETRDDDALRSGDDSCG